MNERGKSDGPVVLAKPPNKPAQSGAEVVEGRGPVEGNTASETRAGRRAGVRASSDLERVRRVAQQDRDGRLTALLHHVTVERLAVSFRALRPGAAAGVDGVTWREYERGLAGNLRDLHARVQCGAFRAKPSRRAYIAKADGGLRPLGIAALEDKIVQRAVVEVLNAIYETDFLGFSYGFRPGRKPHDALDALAAGVMRKKVNWVLDADIRDYFESLDQAWLVRLLEHRIADRRVLRLIKKWLAAGVLEDGYGRCRTRACRRERRCRLCSQTCTCTMSLICGRTSGDSGTPAGTLFSSGTPTTSWWAFNIETTPSSSWLICATGSRASGSGCIPTRRA
jgi:RNA-directed DNA polymerase